MLPQASIALALVVFIAMTMLAAVLEVAILEVRDDLYDL
jgi:hypothetical protein